MLAQLPDGGHDFFVFDVRYVCLTCLLWISVFDLLLQFSTASFVSQNDRTDAFLKPTVFEFWECLSDGVVQVFDTDGLVRFRLLLLHVLGSSVHQCLSLFASDFAEQF